MHMYTSNKDTVTVPASSVVVEKQVTLSSTNGKDVRTLGPSTHTTVFSNEVQIVPKI